MDNTNKVSIFEMFPHIYWTKRNPMETTEDKIIKLAEETKELLSTNNEKDRLDEALDVLHCCVEIIRDYPDELVDQALTLHNAKNHKRGYYEPKQNICNNIGDQLNPLHEVDQFVCSECYIHLEDWVKVYYDYDFGYPPDKIEYEYAFKFCPNCGKRVVD